MAKLKRVKSKALFDGALPDRIPVIDKQCDRLLEARAETGASRLKEKEIQAKLIELLHSEKLTQYRHEPSGKIFKIDAPEKVTFKSAPKAGDSSGEEDEEDTEPAEKEKETVPA